MARQCPVSAAFRHWLTNTRLHFRLSTRLLKRLFATRRRWTRQTSTRWPWTRAPPQTRLGGHRQLRRCAPWPPPLPLLAPTHRTAPTHRAAAACRHHPAVSRLGGHALWLCSDPVAPWSPPSLSRTPPPGLPSPRSWRTATPRPTTCPWCVAAQTAGVGATLPAVCRAPRNSCTVRWRGGCHNSGLTPTLPVAQAPPPQQSPPHGAVAAAAAGSDAAQLAGGGVQLWLRADPVLEAYDELKLQQ